MSGKSYVTLEQHACLVCGQAFDTGSLLLDRRLQERFEHKTVTGWGLCQDHQKLYDENYIALVEADPTKSDSRSGQRILNPGDAYRTGRVAHVRAEAFATLFNGIDPYQADGRLHPIMFVEPGVIDWLEAMAPQKEETA